MAKKLSTRTEDESPATVLVVEDEPLLRYALASELDAAGFQVLEAGSTAEAEIVLAAGAPVDVLITDVQMPGPRDGMVLARMVRAQWPETKVIVASGRPPPRCVSKVADAFYPKPYDLGRIIDYIETLTGKP
ncbi:transcriptional regulator [Hyphomicrobium nitrativorans NL23]|uniref:Transcriptional regulator n=1 Tax=Hyphomicrobium nitrativorans NL23 TaxID=1029756 RepID=V5SFV3_9HYPH|nr:response regulator [Hyphomicrobium nitrativorans]AHB49377.1 transcriptional regulator [Hyphomicrobium nitrativorans NL23]